MCTCSCMNVRNTGGANRGADAAPVDAGTEEVAPPISSSSEKAERDAWRQRHKGAGGGSDERGGPGLSGRGEDAAWSPGGTPWGRAAAAEGDWADSAWEAAGTLGMRWRQ